MDFRLNSNMRNKSHNIGKTFMLRPQLIKIVLGMLIILINLFIGVQFTEAVNFTSSYPTTHRVIQNMVQLKNKTREMFSSSVVSLNSTRTPKFIRRFFQSDSNLNCIPQIMCELISAKEPGPHTNTVNDYKYLFKEYFLKSDDSNEGIEENRNLRNGNLPFKKTKRKKINLSSSPEDASSESESSSSETKTEKKTNGLAELMELEDEDEIEDKALADLVNTDPDDFVFALADVKKKQKLKQMVMKGLANKKKTTANSKFLKDGLYVQRKKRQLESKISLLDRIRIAEQVASKTKSSRQCRALFADSCKMSRSGIQNFIEDIKSSVHQGGENQHRALTGNDIKTLIQEIQNQQRLSTGSVGPEVKIVLNLGGSSLPSSSHVSTSSNNNNNMPQPAALHFLQQPKASFWAPDTTTTTSTMKPAIITSSTIRSNLVNIKNGNIITPFFTRPSKNRQTSLLINENLSQLKTSSATLTQNLTDSKEQYKIKLQQASKIINGLSRKMPSHLSKINKPATNILANFASPKTRVDSKKLEKTSFATDSSQSAESLESEEILYPQFQSQLTELTPQYVIPQRLDHHNPYQQQPKKTKRILASVPSLRRNDFYYHHQEATNHQTVHHHQNSPSWMNYIYDFFFKERKAPILPKNPDEWIPSAMRHGKNQFPFQYKHNHPSASFQPQAAEFKNIMSLPTIQTKRNGLNKQGKGQRMRVVDTKSKNADNKQIKKRKRVMKYKTCCSKSGKTRLKK